MKILTLSAAAVFGLSACTVGPDYTQPDTADITPARWRWQPAAPRDDTTRGEWWKVFRDGELTRLERLALAASPTLQAAAARVDQARAAARMSAAGWEPLLTLQGGASREQSSGSLPTPIKVSIPAARFNSFSALIDLNYEIDFWGKVRREVASASAAADSASASYHSAILTLTGDVAAQYFILRAADAELDALRRTIALREQWHTLLEDKFKAGTIAGTDLARAETEVATAKAGLADIKRQRQEASDTLALFCGQPASNFRISERPIESKAPPAVPAGLRAAVLERRPDVAAAERLVAARNAEIGVATAAWFPAVRLTGSSGYLSDDADTLLSSNTLVWSIGPGVSLPITGRTAIRFNIKRREAGHREAVANYRQAVLTAIRDVETSLAQTRYLREQSAAVGDALRSSTQATSLIRTAYEAGRVSYIELLDAERTRTEAELQTSRVAAQRHLATVRLIKALGGGW